MTAFVLFMSAGPMLSWYTTMKAEPVLVVPHVEVAQAMTAPKPASFPIDDPLYMEVKNDPIKSYIYLSFGQISTKVAREALEVAKGESNYNPSAHNSTSTAKGIFQIIDGTWRAYKCQGSVNEYQDNINCAVKIYKSNNNWGQWVAQPVKL